MGLCNERCYGVEGWKEDGDEMEVKFWGWRHGGMRGLLLAKPIPDFLFS